MKTWQEKFDEQNFRQYDTYNDSFQELDDADRIKSFIEATIREERELLFEEIRMWRKIYPKDTIEQTLEGVSTKEDKKI